MIRVRPLFVLMTVCLLLTSGCAYYVAPFVPPLGVAYTNVTAPLDTDLGDTRLGTKSGEASSVCILGLVAYGDASVQAAAANGGLKTVNHVDCRYKNLFGICQRLTVVAYGD